MAVVEAPVREPVSPHDEELLIKEARLRARRRRWTIGLALLVVASTTLIIVGGGKGTTPRGTLARSQSSASSNATDSHNAVTAAVLGGQEVQSVWPVGGETTWVFTMNVTSPYNGAQGVEWTSDGGRSWRNATPAGYSVSGGRYSLGSFFALSAKRAWVVSGWETVANQARPRLLTTNNGGRSWSISGAVPRAVCTLSFSSAADGVCASSNGAGGSAPLLLFATHDGGATWARVFDNTAGFRTGGTADGGLPFVCDKEFSLTTGNVVWAKFLCTGSFADLYRSSDGGRVWSHVSLTQPSPEVLGGGAFTGPVVLAGQRGAVAFTEGRSSFVYATHDGGHSFAPVYPPGPRHPWAVDVVSPTMWRLAYGNEIIGTNDAGTSWIGLTVKSGALSSVLNAEHYGTASLQFSTPSFGWISWFTGNGYLVMNTQDGGHTWRQVAVPGTGPRRS